MEYCTCVMKTYINTGCKKNQTTNKNIVTSLHENIQNTQYNYINNTLGLECENQIHDDIQWRYVTLKCTG
jgi:hypothetical protein